MFVSRLSSSLLFAAVLAAAAFACDDKPKPTSDPAPSASTATTATPATASASASAAPTASEAPATSASAAPTTSAAPTASGAPATSGSASAAAECGTKPLPDCPLQAWMKANANPPMMTNDMAGIGKALDKIVAFAPPGYTNWASIARDGSAAAKAGDMNAVKASCRTCHDQYKQKYKNEMRARKI